MSDTTEAEKFLIDKYEKHPHAPIRVQSFDYKHCAIEMTYFSNQQNADLQKRVEVLLNAVVEANKKIGSYMEMASNEADARRFVKVKTQLEQALNNDVTECNCTTSKEKQDCGIECYNR